MSKRIVCLVLLFVSLTGFLASINVSVHGVDVSSAFVEPQCSVFSTTEKRVGDTFQINYTIANVTNVAGVDFRVEWDPALVEGVSMVENLFATVTPSGEKDNIWPVINEVAGDHVRYTYTYYNLSRAITGGYYPINVTTENYPEGKLAAAIITLKIASEPPEGYLDCSINVVSSIFDANGELIPHMVSNGYYRVERPIGQEEPIIGWPMFHHDLRHTGCSTAKAPKDNNTIWIMKGVEGVGTGGAHSSPAVADGMVFSMSYSGVLWAVDEETGEVVWYRVQNGAMTTCSPAVADGVVFVGGGYSGRVVHALNESTGQEIWSYSCTGDTLASPTVIDGLVLTGCDSAPPAEPNGRVYALNKSDGSLVWSYSAIGSVRSSPAVADGRVYVGDLDGNVYCLKESNGTFMWSYSTGIAIYSSPAVGYGLVFIGSDDGSIYALNKTTGSYAWSYLTGGAIRSCPALSEGVLFVGSRVGFGAKNLYALNSTTGAEIWSYASAGLVESSPAVADGMVFAGSAGDEIYALNQTTGALVWHYDTPVIVEGSPAVADGMLFIASYTWLYAFTSQHDILVRNIKPSKTVVGEGYSLPVNVTIENRGTFTETFNVTASANSTMLGTFTITLENRSSAVACFAFNTTGVAKANYTLSSVADLVAGEAHPEDNVLTEGWVIVTIPGDVNGDFTVDIYDAVRVGIAYGSTPGQPNKWNPNADINGDFTVDIYDAVQLAIHFGQHYP